MNNQYQRNILKTYSLRSIAEEVSYQKLKSLKTLKSSNSLTNKLTKLEYFPCQGLTRLNNRPMQFTINPDSGYKIIWDCIFISCLMYRLCIIPYIIAFSPEIYNSVKPGLLATDLLYLLDMLIKLNTGVIFKGFLITNRAKIIKNNLHSTFLIDFCASFPFQELPVIAPLLNNPNESSIRMVLLIKFLHVYRIKTIIYALEDKFTSINSVTALKFFHFSLLITLLIHWTSCLVEYVYVLELQYNSDLWSNYIESEGFRYLNYLYYILTTVTSVGYYSLNIYTSNQRLVNIMIMCFDIIIFAYILGKLESTLNSYQKEGKKTKRLISKCKAFTVQNKIPNSLRYKILRYILYIREQETKGAEDEKETLQSLSLPLREEVFTQTRGHILAKNKNFSIYKGTFLRFIGYHLRLQYFGPQDRVFDTGENSFLIYFIQNGEVEIFHSSTGTTFKILVKGKCFGEIAFFLGTNRSASAKSVNFSELLTLDRGMLNKILSCRPHEKALTDQLIKEATEVGLSILNIKCYLCKKLGHTAGTCKEYIITLDTQKIQKRMEKSKEKKINLHEAFKFTFSRRATKVKKDSYSLINTKGKRFSVNNEFGSRPELMGRALNYEFRVIPAPIKTKDLTVIEEDSSSEGESTTLPLYMQYRNAFVQNSIRRKEKGEAIKLFDVENLPKIVLNTPSEEILGLKDG